MYNNTIYRDLNSTGSAHVTFGSIVAAHSGPAGKKNGQNSRLPRNLSKNISTTDKMVLYTPYFNSPFPSV